MAKQKELQPQENDWLFSCPNNMPSEQLASILNATCLPIIELLALAWKETWQMGNDVLKAYGFAKKYLYQPGQNVSWDSLNDWMGGIGSTFQGELLIIQDSRAEVITSLALLIDLMYHRVKYIHQRQHLFPKTTIILVLVGWTDPLFSARVVGPGHRISFKVNSLPEYSQARSKTIENTSINGS